MKKKIILSSHGGICENECHWMPAWTILFWVRTRHTLTVKGEALVLHTEWDLESPWKHVSGRVWEDISRKNWLRWGDTPWMWAALAHGMSPVLRKWAWVIYPWYLLFPGTRNWVNHLHAQSHWSHMPWSTGAIAMNSFHRIPMGIE